MIKIGLLVLAILDNADVVEIAKNNPHKAWWLKKAIILTISITAIFSQLYSFLKNVFVSM